MTEKSSSFSLDGEVSLSDVVTRARGFWGLLRKSKAQLALPIMLGTGIGLFFAFGSGEEFTAGAKLVPYRAGGGGAQSGLAGLAGLAGVRLPTGVPGDVVITYDIYPEVAATFDFRLAVAETPIRFAGEQVAVTPATYFDELYQPPLVELVGRYTIGLPGLLLEIARSKPGTRSDSLPDATEGFRVVSREYRKVVDRVGKRISVAVDKRSGVIELSATMPDAVASASLVQATADRLTKTVIEFEVRKAEEQLAYIDEQFAVARARYDVAQRRLAAFADSNRVLSLSSARIEQERLEREASFAFDAYERLAREREQAVLKRNQDAPVFAVLEMPTVPTEKSRPRRVQILLFSLLCGLALGVVRVGAGAHTSRAGQ